MRKAFTMVELIFVIVILGILAGVAIPRLAVTRDDAIITKARSDVATIRSAIVLERNQRMMRGQTNFIDQLDNTTANAKNTALFDKVLPNAIIQKDKGGWTKSSATTYTFSIKGNAATDVLFTYDPAKGSFNCNTTQKECLELVR